MSNDINETHNQTYLVAQNITLGIHEVADGNIRHALETLERDFVVERGERIATPIGRILAPDSVSGVVLKAGGVPSLPQGPVTIDVVVMLKELANNVSQICYQCPRGGRTKGSTGEKSAAMSPEISLCTESCGPSSRAGQKSRNFWFC